MKARIVLLALAALSAAHAQFALSVLNGTTATPVTSLYSFGSIPVGNSISVQFQIRNTANTSANLTILTVAGTGFTLTGAPKLPMALASQATVSFTVTFQAANTGSYSASLNADGISVFLTVTVVPGLTYEVATTKGNQTLGSTPVDFGSVQVGQTQSLQFLILNNTQQPLFVPTISLSAGDFVLSAIPPSGVALQPGKQVGFTVQFQPSAMGARTGTLTIGTSSFSLTGNGLAPPVPTPTIAITLAQAQSAQQGSVAVNFSSASPASGSGTLTLQFQPSVAGATDPAIAFVSGSQTARFVFATGDVAATFSSANSGRSVAFQTGTTAGVLTFTVQIGSVSAQQSVNLAPAAVGFTATQATRSSSSIQVQVTGFDNTRSAGKLSFTFYDNNGNALSPGAISDDATSAFAQYFTGSAGGSFLLNATFPVTGATSAITYFQATFTNSAGTSTTPQTSFQ
ncbi:MAG: choice-of-anchor D domain-containing protein [Acidobacteriia bacterium]|nr:choice-of-anchor D domain-containing protein [Terriglobia bacterium]